MELNLIGTLNVLKTMKMMPNFSELARTFGKDRHTIKKMYDGKEAKIKKKKPSELDPYKDEIVEILSHPGVKVKAAYWYFKNEKKTFIFGCLNNKDYEKMLEILLNEGDELYFYEFDYPNALKYEQLPDNIKQRSQKTCDPRKILDEKQNLKVVCGSLYMLGKLFNAG